MRRGNWEILLLTVLLLLNLTTRLIWLTYYYSEPCSDCVNYVELAENIAKTGEYKVGGELDVHWPPLWPYVLSIGKSINPPADYSHTILIGLQLLNCLLLWLIARELSPKLLVAIVALLLFALNPSHLMMSTVYSTEHLFTALVNLFFLIVIKSMKLSGDRSETTMPEADTRDEPPGAEKPMFKEPPVTLFTLIRGIGAGICLGLATLARGTTLPLIFLLPILCVVRLRKGHLFNLPLAFWLTVFLFALIPVVLWSYRNYKVSGTYIWVSATGAENFWLGNNPSCKLSWMPYDSPYRGKQRSMGIGERVRFWRREAIRFMITHPFTTLIACVAKTYLLFYPDMYDVCFYRSIHNTFGQIPYFCWRFLNHLIWFIVLFGLLSFIIFKFILPFKVQSLYDPEVLTFLLCIVLFWILIHCITLGHPRYRYPIEHILWMISVIGYLQLINLRKRWRTYITRFNDNLSYDENK
ncbi:hypothetical protein J7M23_01220 [Candidatus Sumerlaeota bacterium]|nr:hypothetical protein [Candidatus Sumerlaeota bacterium]